MASDWLALGTVVLVLLSPGPTNTLLVASATKSGIRRAIPLLSAELVGYLTAIVTVDAFLRLSATDAVYTTTALRLVSAVYLLILAAKTWRRDQAPKPCLVTWRQVLLTTLFNPKALVFSLFLQSLPRDAQPRLLAEFSIIVPIIGTLWIIAGHGVAQAGGLRLTAFVPKATSIALTTFSVLLFLRVFQG